MNTVKLASELLSMILQYLPIGYYTYALIALAPYMSCTERWDMISSLLSVRKYLSGVTEYPDALLYIMRQTDVLLSGSRALNYFVPGSTETDSDWDFYGGHRVGSIDQFVALTSYIGFKWTLYYKEYSRDEIVSSYLVYTGTTTIRGRLQKLQLICGVSISPYTCVLRFDMSHCQCFISGFFAASLYHNMTSKNRGIEVNRHSDIRYQKYNQRGFDILKHDYSTKTSSSTSLSEYLATEYKSIMEENKYRHLCDYNTCIVSISRDKSLYPWHTSKETIKRNLPLLRWHFEDGLFIEVNPHPYTGSRDFSPVYTLYYTPCIHPMYKTMHSHNNTINIRLVYNNYIIGYTRMYLARHILDQDDSPVVNTEGLSIEN